MVVNAVPEKSAVAYQPSKVYPSLYGAFRVKDAVGFVGLLKPCCHAGINACTVPACEKFADTGHTTRLLSKKKAAKA